MELDQTYEEFTLAMTADGLAASTLKLNKAACLLVDWMIEQVSDSECSTCDISSDKENGVHMKANNDTD